MAFPTDYDQSPIPVDQAADEPPLELCVWDALMLSHVSATGCRRRQVSDNVTVLRLPVITSDACGGEAA